MDWQLAEAKNRLSELVTLALEEGPQRITRRKQAVVVIDEEEYRRLIGKRRSLKELLLNAPCVEELDITRDKTPPRDIIF